MTLEDTNCILSFKTLTQMVHSHDNKVFDAFLFECVKRKQQNDRRERHDPEKKPSASCDKKFKKCES